jgi:hypothetical protein
MSEETPVQPKKGKVDKELVYKLACIQCTPEEIAEVVGMKTSALKRKFKYILAKGKEAGKKSLRRAMWEKAINGDTRVQIFLSKQYLGMKELPEDTANKAPLPWSDEKI